MQTTGPRGEHLRLSLQLILQAHLHQLDAGLTEAKVETLCNEVGMRKIPATHGERLETLQVLAAQLLPLFD